MDPQNPAANAYDYQNGRGLDGFLSAAIDSVSWETSLSSVLNTLGQAPIGQSANAYTNTAINYDASQIAGSQSGTTTLGGSGGGTAGTGGSGNLQIDATKNRIVLSDGTVNRLALGQRDNGTFGLDVSAPGKDATSNFLIFTSDQITGSQTFSPITILNTGGVNYPVTVPHNLGFVPSYQAIAIVPNGNPFTQGLPSSFYTNIANNVSAQDANGLIYLYASGVDATNFYFDLNISNSTGSTFTSISIQLIYFISKARVV